MQQVNRNLVRIIAVAVLAPLAGACSSDFSLSNVSLVPKPEAFKSDWLTFSGGKNDFTLRPVTPDDLIGPEGQCASAGPDSTVAAVASADSTVGEGEAPGAAPLSSLVQGGIALQMTECDVVRRAGVPEKIDVGTNERGERSVIMTYVRGVRPGIYHFAGGRLFIIEKAPEPLAPPKRHKQKKPAKKPARV